MENLILFGGTFDPVHKGHIFVVNECIEWLNPQKVIVIPANIPPNKKSKLPKSSAQHRFNMCKLVFKNTDKVEISDYEIKKCGISYTLETVKFYKKIYPNSNIYLLMGADNLLTFNNWNKYNEILKFSSLLVVLRKGSKLESLCDEMRELIFSGKNCVKFLGTNVPLVSSTEVRKRLSSGTLTDGLVPDDVRKYIRENELYTQTYCEN